MRVAQQFAVELEAGRAVALALSVAVVVDTLVLLFESLDSEMHRANASGGRLRLLADWRPNRCPGDAFVNADDSRSTSMRAPPRR